MTTFTDIFGGTTIGTAFPSYSAISLTANTTLSWPSQFQDANDVATQIIDVTPTADGFTLTLPSAEEASVGQSILLVNPSAYDFTVSTNEAAQTSPVDAGTSLYAYLIANGDADGEWRFIPWGSGYTAVTSVNATVPVAQSALNLVVTGTPALPLTSAGSINFAFGADLSALIGFGTSTGIPARTNGTTYTWALRTITGTANQISVANGGGVAGNPTISLPNSVTINTSLNVGNLLLSGNSIAPSNGLGYVAITGNLRINPVATVAQSLLFFNGAGTFSLAFSAAGLLNTYNCIWPTSTPTVGQVMQASTVVGTAAQLSWANVPTVTGTTTINNIAKFASTSGQLQNSGITIDASNNVTGINQATIGNITLGITTTNTVATLGNSSLVLYAGTGEVQSSSVLSVMGGNALKLYETGSNNYTSFTCPTLAANIPLTLPNVAPTAGQVLHATAATTLAWSDNDGNNNLLINGSMSVWQRSTSISSTSNITNAFINTDGSYTADDWILKSDTNVGANIVTHQRIDASAATASFSKYAMRMTVVTTGAKFGIAQFLEAKDTSQLIGSTVSISFSAKASGITNVRAAIVGWSGAADSPTKNFVALWGATGTNPTPAVNWSMKNTASNITVGASWARYKVEGINLSDATLTNIAVFVWVDDTTASVNSTLDITSIKLEVGAFATNYIPRLTQQDVALCQRYFCKDLPLDIEIGRTLYDNSASYIMTGDGNTNDNTAVYNPVIFPVRMRTSPTVVTYPYTTTANTTRASSFSGTDLAANTAAIYHTDEASFTTVNSSGAAAGTSAMKVIMHWYASSELGV